MAVPFSNTHLRVPRGFGNILEGLCREILRDQPEDIPKYAAQYFSALLKQREDSGVDPAEWTAKLEDRFYNNHAFKATEAGPEKEHGTEGTVSKEKSYKCLAEDESIHSIESSKFSSTQPNVSKEVDLTESSGEEEDKHDVLPDDELLEEQSVSRLSVADIQSGELSGTEEARDPSVNTLDHNDRPSNGKDSSVPDQHVLQSDLDTTNLLSFRGISNVDICAEKLGIVDHEGGDNKEAAAVDKEILVSEGEDKNETEEPVDVHATEPVGTERTVERPSPEDGMNVIEEKSSKPKPQETIIQSPPQSEIPEDSQQELEEQPEKTKEEGTEAEMPFEGIHPSLTHMEGSLDSSDLQKEDSLVEINFEDVPEAQQLKEVEEKQPEVEDSVEVLQANRVQMQKPEQFSQVTAVAIDQNISAAQDYKEPEADVFEKEINSKDEEKESQHDIIMEKVGTHDSNSNDSEDEEKVDRVKTVSSSHQPTSEADEENPGYGSDHRNEDNGKSREGEAHQNEPNDPDFEEETEDTVGGDTEGMHREGYSELEDQEGNSSGVKTPLSPITQSSTLTPAVKAESDTFEPSERHLPEEDEESLGVLMGSQQGSAGMDKEVTSMEASLEAAVVEGHIDSEIQQKSDVLCDMGSLSPTLSADWLAADQEGRPPESGRDATEPEGFGVDKQEDCSRPQEEEDIMDIPLDDPEANRAAAKIQAGFRGHMTRKKMKPEDKAEGEEVSSTGDVPAYSQGDKETEGSAAVEGEDTSVPEQ